MIFYLRQYRIFIISFNRSTNVIMTVHKGVNHVNVDVDMQMGFDPAMNKGTCQIIGKSNTGSTGITNN